MENFLLIEWLPLISEAFFLIYDPLGGCLNLKFSALISSFYRQLDFRKNRKFLSKKSRFQRPLYVIGFKLQSIIST